MVVRPDAGREQVRDVACAVGLEPPREQAANEILDLEDRLARDVRHDQRVVVALPRELERREDRRRRVLAELRIDGPERGVRVHHDLVGGERDQRAAAHRVVRNHSGDLAGVVGECARDLGRGEDQAAGRVEHHLDGAVVRRLADRAQDALGVVDVDIARDREPEQRHCLLPVDERDDGRLPRPGQQPQTPPPCGREVVALQDRLQRREDEEEPEEAERVQALSPSSARHFRRRFLRALPDLSRFHVEDEPAVALADAHP